MTIKELKPGVIPTREEVVSVYNRLMSINRRVGSDTDVYTTIASYETALASDGSGNVSSVLSNDPNNSAYWATISSNFEQWRVLGIHVKFVPTFVTGGSTALFKPPLVYVTDFDSSSALTSYTFAKTFSNCREVESYKTISFLSVEDDSSGANWNDTQTQVPINQFWVKFFGSGFTASTALGRLVVDYIVQFKNRGA